MTTTSQKISTKPSVYEAIRVPPHLQSTGDICLYEGHQEGNKLINCYFCEVGIHVHGYGKELVTKGYETEDWICMRCRHLLDKGDRRDLNEVKCKFGPDLDGCVVLVNDFGWVHVTCANWLNDVYFNDQNRDTIVYAFNDSKPKYTCYIGERSEGSCTTCEFRECISPFHIRCAIKRGLIRKYDEMEFAIGERGAQIWPVFGEEHQDIGYSTLKKEGIGGVHLKQIKPQMQIKPLHKRLQVFGSLQNYEINTDNTDPINMI